MSQTAILMEKQRETRRRKITANGQQDAWNFVVETGWNLLALRERLADEEETRSYPRFQTGSMAPGASPRIFTDAFIATLKEAIAIIETQQSEATPA